jgi:hypothetical protein
MRTSLRFRNPGNAPEPWQARVLGQFEQQAKDAPAAMPLEHFERAADGSARYMLAIRSDGVCLACHGAAVPAALQQTLQSDYPHDRATGYALGDIRGAFSVTWPAPPKGAGS